MMKTSKRISYLHFLLKRIINLINCPDVFHYSVLVKKVSTRRQKQDSQSD